MTEETLVRQEWTNVPVVPKWLAGQRRHVKNNDRRDGQNQASPKGLAVEHESV
jgi:hypothetical protein